MKQFKITEILERGIWSEEQKRAGEHIRSGKLSASALGMPMQWNILKYLGIPKKENDTYELLKFRRGRDVEDFLIKMMVDYSGFKVETQIECIYRDCIGYLDALIVLEKRKLPIEVKSTGARAYNHILKEGQAKKNHALQAAYYALALGLEDFAVAYINSDTYQSISFEFKASKFKAEIDAIIDLFDKTVAEKKIPVFIPQEKWMSIGQYQQYPEYAEKTPYELAEIAKELYAKKA